MAGKVKLAIAFALLLVGCASQQAINNPEALANNYFEYSQEAYEQAILENKTIFLDFYASWCPICKAEEPEIIAAFNIIESSSLAGFRVNYNDGDTDADEKELARALNIPYQHTKVIIKDGKEVTRTLSQSTKEDITEMITKWLK